MAVVPGIFKKKRRYNIEQVYLCIERSGRTKSVRNDFYVYDRN